MGSREASKGDAFKGERQGLNALDGYIDSMYRRSAPSQGRAPESWAWQAHEHRRACELRHEEGARDTSRAEKTKSTRGGAYIAAATFSPDRRAECASRSKLPRGSQGPSLRGARAEAEVSPRWAHSARPGPCGRRTSCITPGGRGLVPSSEGQWAG